MAYKIECRVIIFNRYKINKLIIEAVYVLAVFVNRKTFAEKRKKIHANDNDIEI